MTGARLKHYGWGREGEGMTRAGAGLRARPLPREIRRATNSRPLPCRALEDLALRAPRVDAARFARAPSAAPTATTAPPMPTASPIPDYVRAMLGDYACAPDVVAYPRNEAEIAAVMDWAGGVERLADAVRRRLERVRRRRAARRRRRYKAAVTLDLRHLGKVLEVDRPRAPRGSRAAPSAPRWKASSSRTALTLRHFPQSFEYSTLGGWIATRSGGHFASLYTHIDDFVESLRVVTPRGMLETRRLPGSGAGPSPDRHVHRLRGHARRHHAGLDAAAGRGRNSAPADRCASRSSSPPRARCAPSRKPGSIRRTAASSIRAEAYNTGAGDGSVAIMVLAFESADHPLDAWMKRALECCADHGGAPEAGKAGDAHREGAAGIVAQRLHPHALCARVPDAGRPSSTTPSRPRSPGTGSKAFHDKVKAATERAIHEATGRQGRGDLPLHPCLSRRAGAVFLLPCAGSARRAARAVAGDQERGERRADRGRRHDHASSRGRARPSALVRPPAARAVRRGAARGKAALDPQGMLNPGVLIDP